MKGPFLSKRVYKRIRGETSVGEGGGGGRVSPYKSLLSTLREGFILKPFL